MKVCAFFLMECQEQIVQVVKVMPPGRPLERMVEQIGGLLPHHVMEEVVKVILEEIRDIPQGRKL